MRTSTARWNGWGIVAFVSLAALIPIYWLPRIEACDLGSHTYNAWLRQLIVRGEAPGLYLASQSQNVLFDDVLYWLAGIFGFRWGERVAVSICVLIFFWGLFALASALAHRFAWSATPAIAMLAYGWVFNMGFFNMYLSVGLSFIALALLWRWRWPELLMIPPLLLLIWRAHVFGTIWVVLAAAYILVCRRLPFRWQLAVVAVVLGSYFMVRHWVVNNVPLVDRETDIYWMFGFDQFVIYGHRYYFVALAFCALLILSAIFAFAETGREVFRSNAVPLHLFLVLGTAVCFAPGGIFVPHLDVPLGMVPDRASALTVAIGICFFTSLRLRKWQVAALGAIAIVYFSFLLLDMAKANAMERKVEMLVSQLPPGQRVAATLEVSDTRIVPRHIVDRACIGRCFSYANYEPSTREFRIRARPGNPIVTAIANDSDHMQQGEYVVRQSDLPLYQVYFCGSSPIDLCLTPLSAGQTNGELEQDTPVWR